MTLLLARRIVTRPLGFGGPRRPYAALGARLEPGPPTMGAPFTYSLITQIFYAIFR
jgi:hypothetical protein